MTSGLNKGQLLLVLCILSTLFYSSFTHANELAENYINKYKDIAINEMERTGIPASIKLAQGMLESNWGRSTLCRKAKNHFGIKCGPGWRGDSYYLKDDEYGSKGQLVKSCFRVYESDYESYIAHSEFLTDQRKHKRYGFLFSIPADDYTGWAKGLYKAGYATDRRYASKLIQIIEKYALFEYDTSQLMASEPTEERKGSPIHDTRFGDESTASMQKRDYINGVPVIYPKKMENLAQLAMRARVPVESLKMYNEKIGNMSTILEEDIPIFLRPKMDKYSGAVEEHRVKNGESMFKISQKFGVQLEALYAFNRMPPDSEPRNGELIKLNGYAHWGKRPKFIESERHSHTAEETLLFEDEDFENRRKRSGR